MHKLCALTYHFKYLSQLAPDLFPILLHPFQIIRLIAATFTFGSNVLFNTSTTLALFLERCTENRKVKVKTIIVSVHIQSYYIPCIL